MAENLILAETTRAFAYSSTFGAYASSDLNPSYSLEAGQEYKVVWDGVEHTRTAFAFVNNGFECVGVGNPIAAGQADNGDLFCIGYNITHDIIYYLSLEQTESHTVAIYQIVEEEAFFMVKKSSMKLVADSIRAKAGIEGRLEFPNGFKTAIEGITGSGGSAEDVRYVTFMSEDGTEELGKIPVATGYDCPDPKFAATKESTDQFNFTHDYWATEPNGATDPDALKAVTEDRVVYATFISVLRSYTITFCDGDTVVNSKDWAYGSTPSYTPTKDGYDFVAWEPAVVPVTGEASYTATWKQKSAFASATWEEISAICESGEASTTFKVGDTREITVYGEAGVLRIIDFDHDDKADGSGKAGITAELTGVVTRYGKKTFTQKGSAYGGSELDGLVSALKSSLPSDLQAVMKTVTKKGGLYYNSCNVDMFPLGLREMNYSGIDSTDYSGTPYAYYAAGGTPSTTVTNNLAKKLDSAGNAVSYWLRDAKSSSTSTYPWYYMKEVGTIGYENPAYSDGRYISFAICI